MKLTRRHRPRPHIDMTPLIDCVFTLMIILMLAASFQTWHLLKLALPQAAIQDATQTPEVLVSIDAQGNYYVNAERIDPGQLEANLKPRLARSRHRIVTFRGDQKIPYQWFVTVLEAARASGAAHVDIVHDLPQPR